MNHFLGYKLNEEDVESVFTALIKHFAKWESYEPGTGLPEILERIEQRRTFTASRGEKKKK